MQEHCTTVSPSIYGVSLSVRGEGNLLTPKKSLAIDKVEDAFDRMFRLLHRKKLHTTGCAVLLNLLDCQEEVQNRVGVSISELYSDEFYQTFSLSATPSLSVIHYGDYYKIGYAYNALLSYADQCGYSIDDTVMERYFIDSSHGASPNEYVTEISVILKNIH